MKNIVVMFPYTSGKGLYIGHYYNYSIVDSYCRYLRYIGEQVFQPFGYDAFGLPAENYARTVGRDPRDVTYENIDNFRTQMDKMGTEFQEILVTSDESYYKWTQWLFLKLKERGLAYKKDGPVNWCDSCQTVIANEQVVDNKCERCNGQVAQRSMNQWYLKITAYKDRLIKNLENIDYPAGTIKLQRNWLNNLHDWCVSRQRKWGCPIPIKGEEDTLDTFVDSSFYFLRYLANSDSEFLPAKNYRPVDLYVGGSEHATMHLIYARFIHMFLYDIGVVPQEEPFNKVIHQGMITFNGAKMSKSKNNVVNPDDFNPDELRLGLMFIGPYTQGGEWNDGCVTGVRTFIKRFKTWTSSAKEGGQIIDLADFKKLIKFNVETFKFNLVVSNFMKLYNQHKKQVIDTKTAEELVKLFCCFAPNFNLIDNQEKVIG